MILNASDSAAIAAAARALRDGGLVGLPTETVYGLGADAENPQAVAQVFASKGRPADHPLIVHISDHDGGRSGVDHFASQVPVYAQQLMAAFWPGALTLILPRRPERAAAAAGGQASIGLRCPSHPVTQALLRVLRGTDPGPAAAAVEPVWGIAAPSANRFGRVSPTTAAHVQDELGDALLVLDGGPCDVGIESTIVDCTRASPALLRPGAISRAQIEAVCGCKLLSKEELLTQIAGGLEVPKASGTLDSHYAPNAQVRLMDAPALQTAVDMLGTVMLPGGADAPASIAIYARTPLKRVPLAVALRRMPDDAQATAHQLFAVLRALDATGVKLIWVETPPDTPQWEGVRDRLHRAAA